MIRLHDAHNHLHDARLAPHRPAILAALRDIGLASAVVNGTREADWSGVAELARELPWVIPSFGYHPWYVRERTRDWLGVLRGFLESAGPRTAIGEIGLDRWIPDHDLADQREVFIAQLRLAVALHRPVTIHCLQAWGALDEVIRDEEMPARGFLIHAYSGPAELIEPFAKRGAYFSFNASFMHPRKQARREIFRAIPLERLLLETDAPDMAPPAEFMSHPLPATADGKILNHPANLGAGFSALAALRAMPEESLALQLEENLRRLFG